MGGMRILGPLLMFIALALISFVTYTYFTSLLPLMVQKTLIRKVVTTFVGLFLVTNMLYNYLKASCTDPGIPPEYNVVWSPEACDEGGLKPKQCSKCKPPRVKPTRAHHCSVCRRCVLRMDHHCPWINNCVGFCNHRYFCLFILYLVLCCAFVLFTFMPFTIGYRHPTPVVKISFTISCAILVALCGLGGFHVFLVLSNQTTIEFQVNILQGRQARKNGEFDRDAFNM